MKKYFNSNETLEMCDVKVAEDGPVGLLPLLPQEFTRDDVRALRIAQGLKPDPKMAISNWVKRGLVSRDESRGLYVKVVSSQ